MLTTKFIDIPPLSGVAGTVRVQGSKSISNRALLLSGFASGTYGQLAVGQGIPHARQYLLAIAGVARPDMMGDRPARLDGIR